MVRSVVEALHAYAESRSCEVVKHFAFSYNLYEEKFPVSIEAPQTFSKLWYPLLFGLLWSVLVQIHVLARCFEYQRFREMIPFECAELLASEQLPFHCRSLLLLQYPLLSMLHTV